MTVSRIRKGNRITIPHDIMAEMDLHVGDEIFYQISGVIERQYPHPYDGYITIGTTEIPGGTI